MKASRPLIVGEVLVDQFPSGKRVLGGAPLNVAWNLQGLGWQPLLVSAVGADAAGREIRDAMRAWGMDTTGLHISEQFPTGRVHVTFQDGEPSFQILDHQAYDDIRAPDLHAVGGDFSLLYQGSLAYRHAASRSAIRSLMEQGDLPRFVDINIRPPWVRRELAAELLEDAQWIKLNRDELSYLADTPCHTRLQIVDAVATLRRQYRGQQFFVTCGAGGAYAMDETGEVVFVEAPPLEPFVDAVGAGDAFASAVIVGIARGLPLDTILTTAVVYASQTCTLSGATCTDPAHYTLPEIKG